jgi:hypoxanthine phosphoribosyltransferase
MDQGLGTGKSSEGLDRLQNPKYVAPGWDDVYGMLVDLASEIRLSGYNPQVIVGVSRGGWPPARVMSDLLENPNLANMKVEFYKNIGVTVKRPKITQPVTSEVSGKRVLVVDDVADSGQSLRVAFKHLVRKGAREIRVCTLYLKPKSVFKPNHFARTTSKWVIFPWERLEAINLIKRNLRSDGKTYEIVRELKGSGLSGPLIRKLLALD